MIADPSVFDDEHLPHRLLHREREEGALLDAWEPALDGDQPNDVLLHGPSGVGKTVLSRHALQRLAEQTTVQSARVRCLGETTTGIVRAILEELPGDDPAQNTPREDLCVTLQERVDEPTVAVLDEADDLPATDALERLADVRGLGVVAICHDPDDWLARCDQSVRQRIGVQLGLERYGVDELADILEERARQGLAPGSVTRAQLEELADRVAGVAREGIQALRWAAKQATDRGHEQITEQDLDDGPELARFNIRQSNLNSLPLHHQVLYEIVRDAGRGIEPAALHERYDAVAEGVYDGRPQTPISERARRRKLQKLVDYDLVEREGENRHREYRVCDERVSTAIGITPLET